ncbi:MAG TPA: translation initiation factor IF-2, partial [Thermoclostridium caenicola]|nr:translation initiation factor IF-2 [Thermoclostridium caenicola]
PQKGRLKKKIDIVGHKASVSDMMSDDFVIDTFYDDEHEVKNVKRVEKKLKKGKLQKEEKQAPPKAVLTDITIPETITVRELAEALKKTAAEVIKKLFLMGITVTQNEELDFDTAAIIADEFGVKVHKAVVVSEEDILFDESEDAPEDLKPRAPVVVVMGHVDHGKTSLLDAIRSTNIAESEAGGITQRIGAYTVNLNGRDITFLDTPGHEAFTAMRARGAQVTDIAILVVAADDGVMPQTVEAINHAKAAGVSIIVAINKIDKPNANPDKVKQELAEHGLLIEEWGGDVIAVPVSAKKRENIDQLLEMVLLTADILELKANPNKQAKGTVIEASLDKNRGPVATLLVQRGTLRVGDFVLSGSAYGHIRSMVNDKGKKIKEAGPSVPVEVFGLSEVPEAGELFYVVEDEKLAKQLAEKRKEQAREKLIGSRGKVTLEDLFNQIQQGQVKDLNLIVKADVQGSVEAVKQSMEKLSNEEVKVKVIHGAVGAITESDVSLANVSNAIIIGFNVRPGPNVMEAAQAAGVDLRLYRVIYDAIEDIQNAMKGMLKPTYKEVVDGHVEIRQLFKVSSVGTIGGAYVLDGKIARNSDIRLVRNGIVIYEGKLASLKRFKDDVREVAAGYECGLMIEKFNDIKEGDIIEAYHMEEIKR